MSKPDCWMPLYVADYLSDTTHLNTEQHGAYLLLLMAAWKRGGRLPVDDEQLAAIARMDAKRWAAHRRVLLEFFDVEGDHYIQKRLEAEYQKSARAYASKLENGRKGGRPAKRPDTNHGTDEKPPGFVSPIPPGERTKTQPQPHSPNGEERDRARVAGEVCIALRQVGVASTNPSHPDLLELIAAGAGAPEFADLARELLPGRQIARPFPYLLQAMRARLEAARAPVAPANARPRSHADERAATIAAFTTPGFSGRTVDGVAERVD